MRKGLKIKYRRRRERKEVEKDTDNCRIVFFSFGWFHGFWILCADVSEHSVPSAQAVYTAYKSYKDYTRASQPRLFKKWSYCFMTPDKHKLFFSFKKTSESELVTSLLAARAVDISRQSEQVCVWASFHTISQSVPNSLSHLITIDWLIAGCYFRRQATLSFTECVLQYVAWILVINP